MESVDLIDFDEPAIEGAQQCIQDAENIGQLDTGHEMGIMSHAEYVIDMMLYSGNLCGVESCQAYIQNLKSQSECVHRIYGVPLSQW